MGLTNAVMFFIVAEEAENIRLQRCMGTEKRLIEAPHGIVVVRTKNNVGELGWGLDCLPWVLQRGRHCVGFDRWFVSNRSDVLTVSQVYSDQATRQCENVWVSRTLYISDSSHLSAS